jgi:hypothetical protein
MSEMNPETCNYFLASFGPGGFECVIDITEHYYDNNTQALALLAATPDPSSKNPAGRLLWGMTMRARFNLGNEVYGLVTDKSITEDDLKHMADEEPQELANLLRTHGVQFAGPRAGSKPKIV